MRPNLLTHPNTPTTTRAGGGPTSRQHQGTTTETKNHHLDKDARIHYPVLKHPSNTHTQPRHQTPPPHPPHPPPPAPPTEAGRARTARGARGGRPGGQRYACGRGPASEETTNPHPAHRARPPPGGPGPGQRRERHHPIKGARGLGLSPQDPTVRHPRKPTPTRPRHRAGTRDGGHCGTLTTFPPTSTHPAALTAARG